MLIRTDSSLYNIDQVKQIFLRHNNLAIEVCLTLKNDNETIYPIYQALSKDDAVSFLNNLQNAYTLKYAIFDVRLHNAQQKI